MLEVLGKMSLGLDLLILIVLDIRQIHLSLHLMQIHKYFYWRSKWDYEWYVVLNPPNNWEYGDPINEEALCDISLNCSSSNSVSINVFEEINDDHSNHIRTDYNDLLDRQWK